MRPVPFKGRRACVACDDKNNDAMAALRAPLPKLMIHANMHKVYEQYVLKPIKHSASGSLLCVDTEGCGPNSCSTKVGSGNICVKCNETITKCETCSALISDVTVHMYSHSNYL